MKLDDFDSFISIVTISNYRYTLRTTALRYVMAKPEIIIAYMCYCTSFQVVFVARAWYQQAGIKQEKRA